MRQIFLILKIAIAPGWVSLLLLMKGGRLLAALVLSALLSGCASTTNKFDKSPCACNFEQINAVHHGGKANV